MCSPFVDKPEIYFAPKQNRLYMRHGPIDLFVTVECDNQDLELFAYKRVSQAFEPILAELSDELTLLRKPVSKTSHRPRGRIAANQYVTASLFAKNGIVTPMICVAGAVADYLLNAVVEAVPVKRAFVNNGGDIALHLADNQNFTVGICNDTKTGSVSDEATIQTNEEISGIATSGWAGRSQSLGIADAVTVFAETAALADCAATLIANAVNLPLSHKVSRLPAWDIHPDGFGNRGRFQATC